MSDELAARVSQARRKIVGTKQTLKALEREEAVMVLLAGDADEKISAPVEALAADKGIEIAHVETMSSLGRICGIKVKAAAAAIIEF